MAKSTFVKIRATEEQLAGWKETAQAEGLEFSAWVRKRLDSKPLNTVQVVSDLEVALAKSVIPTKCTHGEFPGKCPYPLCRNYGYKSKGPE